MSEESLSKYIASTNFCSRRQAENLIKQGRVKVNDKLAIIGMKVGSQDRVKIDNQLIKPETKKFYIKLNKPKGYVCTNRKFKKEKSVLELINLKTRLFVVGRLDKDSHGLVILTNDGSWAHKMTHPSFKQEKEYLVKVVSKFNHLDKKLEKLVKNSFCKGIDIGQGDGMAKAKQVELVAKNIFKIILIQGKKRQIKRMFQALNLEVIDLQRIRIGSLKLGNLKLGDWSKF